MQQETVREAVGVFYNIDDLNKAVAELETTAFPRQDISVLSNKAEIEDKYRLHNLDAAVFEDDPEAPRTVLIRPEEKAIGAAVLAGAGVYAGVTAVMLTAGGLESWEFAGAVILGGLTGGVLGGLLAWMLGRDYRHLLETQIRRGRMLLWVRTPGPKQEQLACSIMSRNGGQRVHVHELATGSGADSSSVMH